MALLVCARPLVAAHRALARAGFLWGASGLHLPFRGSASGGGSCVCLPSRGGVSTLRPRPALSRAQGTSASDLAAVAFSASPAGSKPAVPSTSAGAVPTTGSAPPRSCALTPEGLRFLTFVFSPWQQAREGHESQVRRPVPTTLPLISAELMLIGWISGLGATGFGGSPLGGNAFTTRQVGRVLAFRADVRGAPFRRRRPLPADSNARWRKWFRALVWRRRAQIRATV